MHDYFRDNNTNKNHRNNSRQPHPLTKLHDELYPPFRFNYQWLTTEHYRLKIPHSFFADEKETVHFNFLPTRSRHHNSSSVRRLELTEPDLHFHALPTSRSINWVVRHHPTTSGWRRSFSNEFRRTHRHFHTFTRSRWRTIAISLTWLDDVVPFS